MAIPVNASNSAPCISTTINPAINNSAPIASEKQTIKMTALTTTATEQPSTTNDDSITTTATNTIAKTNNSLFLNKMIAIYEENRWRFELLKSKIILYFIYATFIVIIAMFLKND